MHQLYNYRNRAYWEREKFRIPVFNGYMFQGHPVQKSMRVCELSNSKTSNETESEKKNYIFEADISISCYVSRKNRLADNIFYNFTHSHKIALTNLIKFDISM